MARREERVFMIFCFTWDRGRNQSVTQYKDQPGEAAGRLQPLDVGGEHSTPRTMQSERGIFKKKKNLI